MLISYTLSGAINLKADRRSHVNRLAVCRDIARLQTELRGRLMEGDLDVATLVARRISQLAILEGGDNAVGELETAAMTIEESGVQIDIPELDISLGLTLRKEGMLVDAAKALHRVAEASCGRPIGAVAPPISFDYCVLATAALARLEKHPVQVMREMRGALNAAWRSETTHLRTFVAQQFEVSCLHAGEADAAYAMRLLRQELKLSEPLQQQWLYHPRLWA